MNFFHLDDTSAEGNSNRQKNRIVFDQKTAGFVLGSM